MTVLLLVGVMVSWIPGMIQLVVYGIAKLIFRHSDKEKVYSCCLAINAVICFMFAYWLLVSDDDDFLPGLIGMGAFVGFGISIGIMTLYHLFKKKKNDKNTDISESEETTNDTVTDNEESEDEYLSFINDGSGQFKNNE